MRCVSLDKMTQDITEMQLSSWPLYDTAK